MAGIVKPCDCVSEFQDKEYGKKMRLHSLSADEKSSTCTVCGKGGKRAKK